MLDAWPRKDRLLFCVNARSPPLSQTPTLLLRVRHEIMLSGSRELSPAALLPPPSPLQASFNYCLFVGRLAPFSPSALHPTPKIAHASGQTPQRPRNPRPPSNRLPLRVPFPPPPHPGKL